MARGVGSGWFPWKILAAFFIAAGFGGSSAAAQPSDYDRVIDEAVAEFGAGHWREARALFERAHEISPNARTLRGRGMAEFELRHYVEAVQLLDAALQESAQALTPELRTKTEELRARARTFVGRFRVSLDPPTAVLSIDGRPANFQADGSVLIESGERKLQLTAPGYETRVETLDVTGGEEGTLDRRLTPTPAPEPAAPPPPPPAPSPVDEAEGEGGILSQWWFWTAAAVVVVGTTVAVVIASGGDDDSVDAAKTALVRF